MKIQKQMANALILGVVATLFAGAAQAYNYLSTCEGKPRRWNSDSTNMYISTTSFPAGSSWDFRLQNAMWYWNNVKGSNFQFYVNRDGAGSQVVGNGRNEIDFDAGLAANTLAVTTVRVFCVNFWGRSYSGILEADIEFNSNVSWSTASLRYSQLGSPFSFEGVALHELGHALGLDHEDRRMATMNSLYPNSGTLGHWKEWDPLGDDRLGVRALYPSPWWFPSSEIDIAGSVFKRTGNGTSGLVNSPQVARRGYWAYLEFSFSNLSTARQSFDIGFYLSKDSRIDTSDIYLSTNYGAWGNPGFTGTFGKWVYIPRWVRPGTYYLGFIVDNNGAVSEDYEGNNYMEMPRSVVVW